MIQTNKEYKNWLTELKGKIRATQLKAAVTFNSALIEFYWELGLMISDKQTSWGSQFLYTLSKDLKEAFPDMEGFSVTNLKYCRLFYKYFSNRPQAGDDLKNSTMSITQQPIAQIPWGHTKLIIGKIKEYNEAQFYIHQTIENQWSREVLLKDPYVFDFFSMSKPYKEKDIERQLVQHVTKFLLELGKGFAFVGQQYHLEIAEQDYYIDLLFYHIKLKCYVVIELKNTKFIPEYAGKLNFYLSAVDSLVKQPDDNPTIGMLLCRDKNNIEAEFALRDINKPMGVSEFQITEILPDNLKSSLPTIEEIEKELGLPETEEF